MSIQWHRNEYRNEWGVPIMFYYTEERDWSLWTIDRLPTSNGSRTDWYEYQPVYRGDAMGMPYDRLRDAKAFVERNGQSR